MFQNKVVIITGAGSGIGAAIAFKLASLNAKLALVDKNEAGLDETLKSISNLSKENYMTVVVDLSKTDDLNSVIPKTIERFGKIDVLVNCAGVISRENIAKDDVAPNYDFVMGINLKVPILLTNKAIPYLRETKGNIVNICSVRSIRANHRNVMYSVSKAGLEMFTKCMAIDLASYGIRANSVHPGLVKTNMWLEEDPSIDLDAVFEEKSKTLPHGCVEPKEVAKVVALLANNEIARSITGSAYYVDGGISLFEAGIVAGKFA